MTIGKDGYSSEREHQTVVRDYWMPIIMILRSCGYILLRWNWLNYTTPDSEIRSKTAMTISRGMHAQSLQRDYLMSDRSHIRAIRHISVQHSVFKHKKGPISAKISLKKMHSSFLQDQYVKAIKRQDYFSSQDATWRWWTWSRMTAWVVEP